MSHTDDSKRTKPHQCEHTSPELQNIFKSLVQQCKAELTNEAAAQDQTSQIEIAQLRAELEEQEQRNRGTEKQRRSIKTRNKRGRLIRSNTSN